MLKSLSCSCVLKNGLTQHKAFCLIEMAFLGPECTLFATCLPERKRRLIDLSGISSEE
jgi:hypothetical protein